VSADLRPARVLLIGMMAVGKSTVGAELAARTGWTYVDNDEFVQRVTGRPTRVVQEEGGTQAMREAESLALQAALDTPAPIIAGVAGGVVTEAADLQRLGSADALVVWLRADIETLVARVGAGESRPWFHGDVEGTVRRLYEGRAERYAQAADLVVDVDDISPDQVAERIVAALRARQPGPT